MPKVTVLPHPGICPNGAEFEVPEGANLAKALVANGVNIDHACEFSCASGVVGAALLCNLV